jgi:hypothetical protein
MIDSNGHPSLGLLLASPSGDTRASVAESDFSPGFGLVLAMIVKNRLPWANRYIKGT